MLVCISLLLVLPVIKGCNEAHTGSGSGSASGSPVSNEQIPAVLDNPDEAGQKPGNEAPDVPGPEPGNEVSASPTDAKEPQILIVSNKETAAPYVHWSWNETLTGSGWVSADGMHLAQRFLQQVTPCSISFHGAAIPFQHRNTCSCAGWPEYNRTIHGYRKFTDPCIVHTKTHYLRLLHVSGILYCYCQIAGFKVI